METNEEEIKNQEYSIWQDLYMKGDDLQKLSVIQSLPTLLQTDRNATIHRIIPKIQQDLPIYSSTEYHLVTSKMFKLLIEMKLDLNLMRAVLQCIESKDPIVATAWCETLLAVVYCLSDQVLRADVLPFAIKLSQINRATFYRINACKLVGQIAIHPKITAFDVKKDIVPITQSLCQDYLYEVRATMCAQLPNIAKGLANEMNVKVCLLPCLVELSNDENMQVRAAAVNAAINLIPSLNCDTIKSTAIPLVKRLCIQSGKEGDLTFPAVARAYGSLMMNLLPYLTDADRVWFLDYYKELSRKGLSITIVDTDNDPALAVTCREFCAQNLPAVTSFTVTQLKTELHKWYSIFKDLAGDPCYLVRKTVAAQIYDITQTLGSESRLIVSDFLKLIRDDSDEVLDDLVPNIGKTLILFLAPNFLSREITSHTTFDIGRALLKCQMEIYTSHNWRRKKIFLEQLEQLPTLMPSDFIHQHFTPLILKLTMESRARPVRTQAARTLLIFLRYNIKENQRKWIRENLINTLCNSNSCYTRHIFINMCYDAIKIFSYKYFKEHFYIPLLGLGDDHVSTVRLCVIKLCPQLKQMLILPFDRNLQMRLEHFVSKIEMMEKDKDVIATLKQKLKEMRSPTINRQEGLSEEKRKIEEEDKVFQGKSLPNSVKDTPSITNTARIDRPPVDATRHITVASYSNTKSGIISRTSAPHVATKSPSVGNISEMSFLDQHFYIDAGVALPETASSSSLQGIEDNMSLLSVDSPQNTPEEIISTVSVENTNIENMSDEDLIELKISTSNITDDVKVNIEKKAGGKLPPEEGVTKRNKRNSCFFVSDIPKNDNVAHLKRRSLNIASNEVSRIPVISKHLTDKSRKTKTTKSDKELSVKSKISKIKKPAIKKTENVEAGDKVSDSNANVCNKDDNTISLPNRDVKENVPINSSIKDKSSIKQHSGTKASNLPVLIKRISSQR